jgi:hypothetical protein
MLNATWVLGVEVMISGSGVVEVISREDRLLGVFNQLGLLGREDSLPSRCLGRSATRVPCTHMEEVSV